MSLGIASRYRGEIYMIWILQGVTLNFPHKLECIFLAFDKHLNLNGALCTHICLMRRLLFHVRLHNAPAYGLIVSVKGRARLQKVLVPSTEANATQTHELLRENAVLYVTP